MFFFNLELIIFKFLNLKILKPFMFNFLFLNFKNLKIISSKLVRHVNNYYTSDQFSRNSKMMSLCFYKTSVSNFSMSLDF
jgi:hypothetical protein